jgi:hypothetical protein
MPQLRGNEPILGLNMKRRLKPPKDQRNHAWIENIYNSIS